MSVAPAAAIVFAYHNVGVRCLRVLLAHGVRVPLVVTHADDPGENVWFGSVAAVAAEYEIPCITPDHVSAPEVLSRIGARPDFLFSFYYRRMLDRALLDLPRRGALNMHGSLLPKYRGRAPVNWAVLHGERETGATLHYMTEKPDNGDIVAQTPVPILPDDTAREVFDKVTVAAEISLDGILPSLLAGTAPRVPQDLRRGAYFGGRKPADGVIDWTQDASAIHNLVRAVAPPYPGAFTRIGDAQGRILRSRLLDTGTPPSSPALQVRDGRLVAHCGGGGMLQVLELEIEGAPTDASAFHARFGIAAVPLGAATLA